MKTIARSMMIVCGAAALALLPACTTMKCAKCGSSACAGKCGTTAPAACPICGKAGCTSCKP